MALEQCLIRALRANIITPQQAEKIRRLAGGSDLDEKRFLESFIQETQEQQRIARLQAIRTKANLDAVQKHPDGIGAGVVALLVRDLKGRGPYSNVDYRAKAILAEYYGRIAETMEAYRTKNLGFSQDTKGIKNMIRELFGEGSNDADARAFAKMWSDAADHARLRFNVAGGNIPKRKDWGLPHSHDPKRIARLSLEQWRDFIVPRLDRNRIFSKDGRPMGNQEFDNLITGLHQQFQEQAGVLHDIPRKVSREVDHRLLTFRNAQSWLEYNEKLGEPDLYHSMMSHLENLAHDTALMEILGPNPDKAMENFVDLARQNRAPATTVKMIRDAYQVVSGRVNQSDNDFLAGLGQSVRNLLSSAQLGSAFISSFTDLWTAKHTLAFNGAPSVKFIKEIFSQMRPGNAEDRIFAVKLGLGAEQWVTRALAASRFQEITGHGLSAKISDAVFRGSLLSPWTDATRKAFGMELSGFIADQAGRRFDELPELLRNSFNRYGITESHWELIRKAPVIERDGARFIRPQDVLEASREQAGRAAGVFREAAEYVEAAERIEANVTTRQSGKGALRARMREGGRQLEGVSEQVSLIRDAANKLQEMMLTEMDFAVPTPDARVRAIITQGQPRGSILGEASRFLTMYKSFPISMVALHLYRGASQIDTLSKAKYLAELTVGLTVMGAIAVQTKEIAKGRDPADMTEPGFWGRAFAQGGGAGIFGDFIQASESRFGRSFTSTMAGPVAGLVDDSVRLTLGNLHEVLRGQETRFGAEAVNFARRYTPGSSAWWARVAMERMIWDSLLRLSDPRASQSFRRIQQNARRNYNQEYWWKPGMSRPERMPDVGAVVE